MGSLFVSCQRGRYDRASITCGDVRRERKRKCTIIQTRRIDCNNFSLWPNCIGEDGSTVTLPATELQHFSTGGNLPFTDEGLAMQCLRVLNVEAARVVEGEAGNVGCVEWGGHFEKRWTKRVSERAKGMSSEDPAEDNAWSVSLWCYRYL